MITLDPERWFMGLLIKFNAAMESALKCHVLMTPESQILESVMQKILLIGLGGGLGAILRYYLGGYVQQLGNNFTFPIGTVIVNLLGCLVIGLLSQLADSRSVFTPEARLFVFIGLLGGFTTFSTFGNESINLLREAENGPAFWYVSLHLFGGLGAVWLGRILAFLIWR